MKLTIEAEPKEVANLVVALQGQTNKKVKLMVSKVLSRFCDDFDLHDEEIDKLLERTAMEVKT